MPTEQPTRALVTTGIHGWSRDPMYVDMFLKIYGCDVDLFHQTSFASFRCYRSPAARWDRARRRAALRSTLVDSRALAAPNPQCAEHPIS